MQPLNNSLGIPAFLTKLWKMVEDPKTDDLICWSKDEKTFIIKNEAEFWYTLLPVYYKHNNMSSFVRQLNMYGFHKVSNLDGSAEDSDKIEYQFFHPSFRKGQPQLLKNIKRKVTNSKIIATNDKMVSNLENNSQLGKVISDVKYLYGRQAQVDNVLTNLKQENSVLWRELAVLRQKHQKQQQIINKLIQFLVTIVQPSARMGGLGVKRRYPLMLPENPMKQQKVTASDGPTIHELDSADALLEGDSQILDVQAETAIPHPSLDKVESPASTSYQSQTKSPIGLLNEVDDPAILEPETSLITPDLQQASIEPSSEPLMNVDELLTTPELLGNSVNINSAISDEFENEEAATSTDEDYDKIYLNPSSQDAFLTNLINGTYNTNAINFSRKTDVPSTNTSNMTIATRDPNLTFSRLNSVEDIDNHVGTTQNELDQLKDFLNSCNGIDSSYLLNLFNETPSYGLTPSKTRGDGPENEVLSGSELAPYDPSAVDFSQLLDDSTDALDFVKPEILVSSNLNNDESINTPDVSDIKPIFPAD